MFIYAATNFSKKALRCVASEVFAVLGVTLALGVLLVVFDVQPDTDKEATKSNRTAITVSVSIACVYASGDL
jgi:hypothetical protein